MLLRHLSPLVKRDEEFRVSQNVSPRGTMISPEYRSRSGLALYTAVFVFAAPGVLATDDAAVSSSITEKNRRAFRGRFGSG